MTWTKVDTHMVLGIFALAFAWWGLAMLSDSGAFQWLCVYCACFLSAVWTAAVYERHGLIRPRRGSTEEGQEHGR